MNFRNYVRYEEARKRDIQVRDRVFLKGLSLIGIVTEINGSHVTVDVIKDGKLVDVSPKVNIGTLIRLPTSL